MTDSINMVDRRGKTAMSYGVGLLRVFVEKMILTLKMVKALNFVENLLKEEGR